MAVKHWMVDQRENNKRYNNKKLLENFIIALFSIGLCIFTLIGLTDGFI